MVNFISVKIRIIDESKERDCYTYELININITFFNNIRTQTITQFYYIHHFPELTMLNSTFCFNAVTLII